MAIVTIASGMAEPDQYRFLIKSAENGVVEVAWSLERDHHPVAVGTVQIRCGVPEDEPIAREAQAYVTEWQTMSGRVL